MLIHLGALLMARLSVSQPRGFGARGHCAPPPACSPASPRGTRRPSSTGVQHDSRDPKRLLVSLEYTRLGASPRMRFSVGRGEKLGLGLRGGQRGLARRDHLLFHALVRGDLSREMPKMIGPSAVSTIAPDTRYGTDTPLSK